jgi:hypothetical protein
MKSFTHDHSLRFQALTHGPQSGSAMVAAMLALTGVAVLSAGVMTTSLSMTKEQGSDLKRLKARYAGDAAVAAALVDLEAGGTGKPFVPSAPLSLGGAEAWAEFGTAIDDHFEANCGSRLEATKLGIEVLVESKTEGLFQYAAFGEDGVWLASNAQVDSYDSELGSYAAVNGSGSSAWANDEATVGSNADIELSQNAKVWGQLAPGPGGVATVLGNAYATGGAYASPTPLVLPPVEVPNIAPTGNINLGVGASSSLPPGNYNFSTFKLGKNSQLTVVGPAELVCGNLQVLSGSALRIDSSAGPVRITVLDDFLINSNTLVAPLDLDPKGLSFQLLSDNIIDPALIVDLDILDFDSNAKMYASIYAPNAAIEINSNFELFGAIIAKELVLDSNSKVHYDESLADVDLFATTSFNVIGWKDKAYGVQ